LNFVLKHEECSKVSHEWMNMFAHVFTIFHT